MFKIKYLIKMLQKENGIVTKNNNKENGAVNNNKYNNNEPLKEPISIFHYDEDPYINKKIESPRSLKSMKELGLCMDDIYFLNFNQFLEKFQDFRKFDKNIQQLRYQFYEGMRLNKINKIKDDVINNKNNINDDNNQQPKQLITDSVKKKLDDIEQKKQNDLMKYVEIELERQIYLKEREEKMLKNLLKNEQSKEKLARTNRMKREKEKREKEERMRKINWNIEQNMKETKERYEAKKKQEENRRMMLEQQRYLEQERKLEKAREKEERARQIFEEAEYIEKQKIKKYYDKQDRIALKQEELQKIKEIEEIKRLREIKEKKLKRIEVQEKNQEMLDQKINNTLSKIKNKAKSVEELMKLKDEKNQKMIEEHREKYDQVLKVNYNNKIIDKKRREEMSDLLSQKRNKIREYEARKRLTNDLNYKNQEILNEKRREFELNFEPFFHNKKIEKIDENFIAKIQREFPDNLQLQNILFQLRKVQEEERIQKEKKQKKLKDKYMQMDDQYMYGKRPLSTRSTKRGKFNNTLTQTFKDSNRYKLIEERELYNNNKFNNNNNNAINKNERNVLINNEKADFNKMEDIEILIQEKLNEFKIKQSNELASFMEAEEKKEKERIELYNNTSINNKEEVKLQLEKEREESLKKISDLFEKNENDYKEFENQLRKKYN